MINALKVFAETVGGEGSVVCAGGRTQWDVGGSPREGTREVTAPSGVVAHEPAEMIVRVRAGTTLAELQEAVGKAGQYVSVESPDPARATVGGVLAVGRSGLRRLGRGPVRDTVLEMTAVSAKGQLIRSGAPLVKNVTGFDVCRLLVGSLGTLALLGEVVLRCRPRPEAEAWWAAEDVDPFAVVAALFQPLAVLWDGRVTWVGLGGYRVDLEDQERAVLRSPFRRVDGPPVPPGDQRRSLPPAALRSLGQRADLHGRWLAEIGVGVVHCDQHSASCIEVPPVQPGIAVLHRELKMRFDAANRLNPGRSVLAARPS